MLLHVTGCTIVAQIHSLSFKQNEVKETGEEVEKMMETTEEDV